MGNKQKKSVKKLNKKLKNEDKDERRLEEAKKDGNEKGDSETQAVEEGEDADDSIRVLDKKPQAMGEADVDESEEKPKAPEDKRGLSDRENEQLKAVDTAMANEKKPDAKIIKNNVTKPLKRRLDDNDKETEENDVKNMDKKEDAQTEKKADASKRRLAEESYILNYNLSSR